MPKTGESCSTSGTYSGRCDKRGHTESAQFQSGDTFTACSTGECGGQGRPPSGGGSAMNWTLVSAKK
ncbi:MAG: hypothetical protein QOG85_841 [Gaiellaceae bacterium]|nr:hypothetical protein [Gaiellaceae bacterium]